MLRLQLWIIETLIGGEEKTVPDIKKRYEERFAKISRDEKKIKDELELEGVKEKLRNAREKYGKAPSDELKHEIDELKKRQTRLDMGLQKIVGSYLTDQHIYRECDMLVEKGLLEVNKVGNRGTKKYSFRDVGCIDVGNGILIAKMYKSDESHLLSILCTDSDICKCPKVSGIRKITKDCKYYDVCDKLKPTFTLKF